MQFKWPVGWLYQQHKVFQRLSSTTWRIRICDSGTYDHCASLEWILGQLFYNQRNHGCTLSRWEITDDLFTARVPPGSLSALSQAAGWSPSPKFIRNCLTTFLFRLLQFFWLDRCHEKAWEANLKNAAYKEIRVRFFISLKKFAFVLASEICFRSCLRDRGVIDSATAGYPGGWARIPAPSKCFSSLGY